MVRAYLSSEYNLLEQESIRSFIIYIYAYQISFSNLTTENLRYLTVDQALADIAHFIPYVKSKHLSRDAATDVPVVLAGSQYAGSLVAWFRQKYPHLVTGVWASNAPLLAKVDNFEYNEIVGFSYYKGECYDEIENGFKAMENMIENNQSAELSEMIGLCKDMGSGLDATTYLRYLSDLFAMEVELKDG